MIEEIWVGKKMSGKFVKMLKYLLKGGSSYGRE